MRVFLTGATGFIGSAIVPELIDAGHQVLGLTRSDAGAQALAAAGAEVHRGDLEDLESLRSGAAQGGWRDPLRLRPRLLRTSSANCEKDRRAIEALGAALTGSDRPLVITSGTGMGSAAPGQPATEDVFNPAHPNPRVASELAGAAMLAAGVNVSVVRLPQVHDTVKQGLITYADRVGAREGRLGLCRRWDEPLAGGARLRRRAPLPAGAGEARARRALQRGRRGRHRGSRHRRGHRPGLEGAGGLPVCRRKRPSISDGSRHLPAWTSRPRVRRRRRRLGWRPTGPGLIADLERMTYD